MSDTDHVVDLRGVEQMDDIVSERDESVGLYIIRLRGFPAPEVVWGEYTISLGLEVLDLPVPLIRAGREAVQE